MYSHPMRNPARPNRGGTHHVVVKAGIELVLHNCAVKGESYCSTPFAEWYESRNGPNNAPAVVWLRENNKDWVGFFVILSSGDFLGDSCCCCCCTFNFVVEDDAQGGAVVVNWKGSTCRVPVGKEGKEGAKLTLLPITHAATIANMIRCRYMVWFAPIRVCCRFRKVRGKRLPGYEYDTISLRHVESGLWLVLCCRLQVAGCRLQVAGCKKVADRSTR